MSVMEVTVKRVARLAVQGDYAQVRQLATELVVTGRISNGQTALMLAAETANPPWQYAKCIEYFLHMGADPDASDPNGDTAAHVAARRDNLRLMALLPFESKFDRNESGLTPLMEAVKACSVRCVQHLLHLFRQQSRWEQRDKLLGMLNYVEQTALDMAQALGQSDIATLIDIEQKLVIQESSVIGLARSHKDECRELKRLSMTGDFASLQLLLNRVNCDLPDVAATTALMWAVRTDISGGVSSSVRDDGVRLLTDFADPTAVDIKGRGCLHWAARAGNAMASAALVVAGASVNCRDEELRTPLMLASMAGVGDSTLKALIAAGADWSLRDRRGRTAAQLAAECNCGVAVRLLRGYEGKEFFNEQIESRWKSHQLPDRAYSGTSMTYSEFEDQTDVRKEDFYPVTDPQGLCLIINVHRYELNTEMEDRTGSEQDVRRISELFQRLGFIVEVRLDCTAQEIGEFLDEKADWSELSSFGCFVCFLMAHGNSDFVLGCDGQVFHITELTEPFQSNRCEYLKGKPKLFFVQVSNESTRELESRRPSRSSTISDLDILVCYAAQCASRRGPILVQNLCDIIERQYQNKDLHTMLMMVSRLHREQDSPLRSVSIDASSLPPKIMNCLSKKVCLDIRGPMWCKSSKIRAGSSNSSTTSSIRRVPRPVSDVSPPSTDRPSRGARSRAVAGHRRCFLM